MSAPTYYKSRIVSKTIPSFSAFQITATVSQDSNSTPQPVETMRLFVLPVNKNVYTPYELAWRDIGSNIEDFMTGFEKMPVFLDEWEVGELSVITENRDTGFVPTTPATISLNLYNTCQYVCEGSLMRYPATGMQVTAEGAVSEAGLRVDILSDEQVRLVFTGAQMVLDFNNPWWSPWKIEERSRIIEVSHNNGSYTGEYVSNGFHYLVSFTEGGPVTIHQIAKTFRHGERRTIDYGRSVFRGSWLGGVFQSESVDYHALLQEIVSE